MTSVMHQYTFPLSAEMSEELVCSIAQECGCSSRGKERNVFLREVLVLAVLALFPGLPFRKLADACRREGLKQKELKDILSKLKHRKLLQYDAPLYSLRSRPSVDRVAEWLRDGCFSPFVRQVKNLAEQMLSKAKWQDENRPIGVMFSSRGRWGMRELPEDVPEYLSPYFMCRILRLIGEHEMAYRLLVCWADHPDLLDYRMHIYDDLDRFDLRRMYYGLLDNKYEPVSAQPAAMQQSALCDNIILCSLESRCADDVFASRDGILSLCRSSCHHELLFSILFHSLQSGDWELVRTISVSENAPDEVREFAVRFCRWTDKKSWSALRGVQKLVTCTDAVTIMMSSVVALAVAANKTSVTPLANSVLRCPIAACGIALSSLMTGMIVLRAGSVDQDDAEMLQRRPIGQYLLLLTALLHPEIPVLSPKALSQAVAACITLHQKGLTLYSWYMASILLSYGNLPVESQRELQVIAESRSDLPPFPGIKAFSGMDELVLEKFLTLANELVGVDKSAKQRAAGRMDWLISLRADGTVVEICPVFCTYSKKGTLSAGRKAGLAALKEGKYDDCLSEQDRAVVASLRYVSSWGGGYYYVPIEAICKLCGHPHLRVDRNGQEYRDCSLALLPPGLTVRMQGDSCVISLPDTICERATLVHLEENKFGLMMPSSADEKLRRLIRQLGHNGELVLPAGGRTAVAEALTALSSQFRLTGDLSITRGNLPEVQSDARLVALLSGRDGSFMGSLGIEPFADASLVIPGKGESAQVVQRGDEKILLHRDLSQEKALLSSLLQACPMLREYAGSSLSWQVEDPEIALDILGELQDYGSEHIELRWPEGQTLSLRTIQSPTAFNLSVGETADRWLEVGGEVKVDENRVLKFTELLELVRQRSGAYIRLEEGQFLRLTRSIARQLETLGHLLPASDKGGRVRKALELSPAAMALLALSQKKETLPTALELPVQRVREQLESHRSSRLPAALRAELRDYQLAGYCWMMQLISSGIGACLADDMGLGKTVQILAVLLAKASEGPGLVLAPASVCSNWAREAARFTPTLRVHRLRNGGRAELLEKLQPRDVLVCSYGLLVSEAEALSRVSWNIVVLDEAQSIKNSRSQRAEQARSLTAKYRIAATGTPLENNLLELWSLMEFLNPGFLGARSSFLSRFKDAPARLRRLIAPFVLRRLKSEVLDELPEKSEQIIQVELSEQERALYEAMRRQALQEMNGETERFRVLAHLTRLRRLCCHPRLGVSDCGLKTSSKLETLRELAAELKAGGHRALVFSQFTDVLEHVRTLCEEEQFSCLYLDGSTPTAARSALVDKFQQGETDFFLISLKAGGVGLNLTAADYVILLDPWWNPASEDQAADRAHRIGQDKNVTVCRLVCADTIEQRVLELHAHKRELVDSVLSDSGAASGALTVDELLQLMK